MECQRDPLLSLENLEEDGIFDRVDWSPNGKLIATAGRSGTPVADPAPILVRSRWCRQLESGW